MRERVLRDLAVRRKKARQQVEKLNAGRERLLQAYDVVRRTIDEATDELSTSLSDARTGGRRRRPTHRGRARTDARGARRRGHRRGAGRSAPRRRRRTRRARRLTRPLLGRGAGRDRGRARAGRRGPAGRRAPARRSRGAARSQGPSPQGDLRRPAPRRLLQGGAHRGRGGDPGARRARSGRGTTSRRKPPPRNAEAEDPTPAAEDVFARLRAEQGEPEDERRGRGRRSRTVAEAPDDEEEEPPAPTPFSERDAALEPVDKELSRRLKRALADEQNEVLDRLRRVKPKGVDDVLPEPEEHAGRWSEVVAPGLADAATAGATWAGGTPGPVDDLAARARPVAHRPAARADRPQLRRVRRQPRRRRRSRAGALPGVEGTAAGRDVRPLRRRGLRPGRSTTASPTTPRWRGWSTPPADRAPTATTTC